MSTNNTLPDALTADGRTWTLLSGNYVLKTISSGTGGTTNNAEATGSTTLTAAQSGVPAHSHGLNSHTHTQTGTFKSTTQSANHGHNIQKSKVNNMDYGLPENGTKFNGNVLTTYGAGGTAYTIPDNNANHTHSITLSGNTGKATGSTANNTATNASQGHTHTAGMPQNIGVYVWKRIA